MTGSVLQPMLATQPTRVAQAYRLHFLVGSIQHPAKPITGVIAGLTQRALAPGAPPEFNVRTETQHCSPVNSGGYPLFKFGFNHLSR